MASIIDASTPCGAKATALFAAGIKTVIRDHSRDTVRPSKRLRRDEAEELVHRVDAWALRHEGRMVRRRSSHRAVA